MAPGSEDPKLIIRVINFELVQPICPRYLNVRDRQTDGQTGGRTYEYRALHYGHRAVKRDELSRNMLRRLCEFSPIHSLGPVSRS